MIGTLVNVAAVIAGSSVGMLLKSRLPEKVVQIVFQVLGLFTLFLGIQMALKTANPLIMVMSLLTGALIGELLALDQRIERFSSRFVKKGNKDDGQRFSQAVVTAFMMFCVGSMTIIGSLEEGLTGKRDLLLTKSLMDLFSSTALASAFGKGVLFSVIPLFIYQSSLTLGAGFISDFLNDGMRTEMIASGGILMLGLGFVILEISKIKVINMLPALVVAPLFTWLAQSWGFYLI
jgi:hypothetical protein